MTAPTVSSDPAALLAGGLGVLGAAMATAGTFADWFTIRIGGVAAAGGSATGWEGRDGRTVLAAAAVCVVAAGLVAFDSRRLAPKIALIVAGFVTAVIAIAGILDTRGKAEKVQDEFAIAPDRVAAEVGAGLWMVAAGGIIEVAAGVAAPNHGAAGGGGGTGAGGGSGLSRSLGRRAGGSAAATAR